MYHTALPHGEQTKAKPMNWWASRGNRVFVHDLALGIPMVFSNADVLYADLPWADGYDEFNRRAGVIDAMPYGVWLYRLAATLPMLKKPWVIVGGYAASRHLACEWFTPIRLNGSLAMAMGAGGPPPPETARDAVSVLQWLAGNPDYQTVGDFCCGYGQTCRIFAEAGKHFIGSDVNPRCIGHIAREANKWQSATI